MWAFPSTPRLFSPRWRRLRANGLLLPAYSRGPAGARVEAEGLREPLRVLSAPAGSRYFREPPKVRTTSATGLGDSLWLGHGLRERTAPELSSVQ